MRISNVKRPLAQIASGRFMLVIPKMPFHIILYCAVITEADIRNIITVQDTGIGAHVDIG